MIGTPFTISDELTQRRITGLDKKPWEQEARDDQGRKHFYGAFTGALRESSVGYKGTVGSREGWAPKEFVSTKKTVNAPTGESVGKGKSNRFQQNIFDYMDDEDMGEHMAGGTIQAHNDFDTKLEQKGEQLDSYVGLNTAQGIGLQLMKAMGFKDRGASKYCFKSYEEDVVVSDNEDDVDQTEIDMDGQELQLDEEDLERLQNDPDYLKNLLPMKRGHQQRLKAPRYYEGPFVFKDNFNGIGYIPTPNEAQRLRDGSTVVSGKSNRISMSEFNHSGAADEEDEDDLTGGGMTKVYDDNESKDKAIGGIVQLKSLNYQHSRPGNTGGLVYLWIGLTSSNWKDLRWAYNAHFSESAMLKLAIYIGSPRLQGGIINLCQVPDIKFFSRRN